MFLAKVVFPVGVEVTVADQGAEFEDGFRTVQAPTGAGNVEPILDQMPAGALDDAGGDRPAVGQRGGIVQVRALVGQVGARLVDAGCRVSGLASRGRQARAAVAASAGQPWPGLVVDPRTGGRAGAGVPAPRGCPPRL